ncbi:nucleotidyltransferase domain-containing protein [Clostridium aceticum]|uniref:Nucleotidyltransferase domain-containing protein n=1 Tax=Clostridium aceticum TaxID=84022 RepID=A0A0D8IAE1_9CLOT|nr:nucleotidyltransferase domain-containing protein [Clostridium aceticum]AKL93669.1 nucleotidyltransferase domain-containing protein [Clostridium aceticum]KJF27243.1 DNA polymerase [Clostridium aceticum]
MKYGLKESILASILEVFSRHSKIEKVLLYGSRAKGNYKNGSDIDLTFIGKNINLEDINKLHLELDELYLPYSFDLSIFEKIENKDLIDHINRVGIIIYEGHKGTI